AACGYSRAQNVHRRCRYTHARSSTVAGRADRRLIFQVRPPRHPSPPNTVALRGQMLRRGDLTPGDAKRPSPHFLNKSAWWAVGEAFSIAPGVSTRDPRPPGDHSIRIQPAECRDRQAADRDLELPFFGGCPPYCLQNLPDLWA